MYRRHTDRRRGRRRLGRTGGDFNADGSLISCEPNTNLLESPYEPGKPYFRDRYLARGYYGERTVICTVSNWGSAQSPDFNIRLKIEDVSPTNNAPTVTNTCGGKRLAQGSSEFESDKETCTQTYDFKEGQTYRVSCEITDLNGVVSEHGNTNALGETNPAVHEDGEKAWECHQTGGALNGCVDADGDGVYEKAWKTNNYRERIYKAVVDQKAVCEDGMKTGTVNVNGRRVGHISAIGSL